jgi:hypothetical protein
MGLPKLDAFPKHRTYWFMCGLRKNEGFVRSPCQRATAS